MFDTIKVCWTEHIIFISWKVQLSLHTFVLECDTQEPKNKNITI